MAVAYVWYCYTCRKTYCKDCAKWCTATEWWCPGCTKCGSGSGSYYAEQEPATNTWCDRCKCDQG